MAKKSNGVKIQKSIVWCFVMWIVFIVFTILVKKVNLGLVGDTGKPVGFSDFNKIFYDMFGFNRTCYNISKVLGYLAFVCVAINAFAALIQLISGKSLKKVSYQYYILGGYYVCVLIMYIFFEKVIINYRPLIIDLEEGLEASYPSSHTMLAISVFVADIRLNYEMIKQKIAVKIRNVVAVLVCVTTVVTRFISGAHWATDIVGGIILSTALYASLCVVLNFCAMRRK